MDPVIILPTWQVIFIAALPTVAALASAVAAYHTHTQMVELTVNTNHIKDELVATTKALALLQGEATGRALERAHVESLK